MAGLSFPLDPFTVAYLQALGLTLILLIPNSWAYLLGFSNFARYILCKKPSMAFFWSIFIVSTKGDFDWAYAFSGVDREIKAKFKGSFSKVYNWKANFIIVQRLVVSNPIDDALPVWGFTTHWGEIQGN